MNVIPHGRCLSRLALAAAMPLAFAIAASGQGIIHVQLPPTLPGSFPYDAEGTQVAGQPDTPSYLSIVINGQTVCTFYSGVVFSVQPSSTSAVIGIQPNLPSDQTSYAVPLTAGQQIGPGIAGNSWVPNILGGAVLTAARGGGGLGQGPLTDGYFTGLESGYIGFQFQDQSQTYFGWIRAGCPLVGINGGWVYDYAYETSPNTTILAGQTSVPEPRTTALLGFSIVILLFRTRYIVSIRRAPSSF